MFAASKTAGATGGVNYIEDVFSTYLTTGAGATVNVVNGIDLSTKGGLVWQKGRGGAATAHTLFDTVRGINNGLFTNTTGAQSTNTNWFTAFNTDGFSFGTTNNLASSGQTGVNWTFRKQPKFFDVVTYTGTGANATIAHSLGSVPGSIIVKRTDTTGAWQVYHRSLANTEYIVLNTSVAKATGATRWNSTTPTSTVFSLGTDATVNASGGTYVAYLFAHNAGGFGLTGTDNVISCGSYTGTGSTGNEQTLGFEPQFLLIKNTSASGLWVMVDIMRKITALPDTNADSTLYANSSAAEDSTSDPIAYLTPTGFGLKGLVSFSNASGNDYIYIAIRRGPMKVPTSGTSVFSPIATSAAAGSALSIGFPTDMTFVKGRTITFASYISDRLRGYSSGTTTPCPLLRTTTTAAEETTAFPVVYNAFNTTALIGDLFGGLSNIFYNFGRAPSFMDVVCHTGTGGTGSRSLSHNLGVTPEFIILKRRDAVSGWQTGSMFTSTTVTRAVLNANNDQDLNSLYSGQSIWGGQPTASTFLIDAAGSFNTSAATYIAYLFATCAGVSKVGSYTGTATTKQVDCGFTAGARFVLIKRTDTTGDWYVWDSARGIVAGNDPYLLLNSTAAEVTTTDYVDTYSAGFEISSTAPAAINASGGTFIFLAIA